MKYYFVKINQGGVNRIVKVRASHGVNALLHVHKTINHQQPSRVLVKPA